MIFLSASVPTPEREFFGTENIFAIREAIIAFTTVCVQYGIRFYFGGHPAITPLVWDVAMQNIKQGMPYCTQTVVNACLLYTSPSPRDA